jgi:hypothetical protein
LRPISFHWESTTWEGLGAGGAATLAVRASRNEPPTNAANANPALAISLFILLSLILAAPHLDASRAPITRLPPSTHRYPRRLSFGSVSGDSVGSIVLTNALARQTKQGRNRGASGDRSDNAGERRGKIGVMVPNCLHPSNTLQQAEPPGTLNSGRVNAAFTVGSWQRN